MRIQYAPDYLTTVATSGDHLLMGVQGQPTIMTIKDVMQGAGGDVASNAAQAVSDMYANIAGGSGVTVIPGDTTGDPATAQNPQGGDPTSTDPCSRQYVRGTIDWFKCKAGANPGGVVGTTNGFLFTDNSNGALNRILFGVLAIVLLGLGGWFILKS